MLKRYFKYGQKVMAFLIIIGLLSLPRPVSAAGTVVYEQAPGHNGGWLSDERSWSVADQFLFDVPMQITNITWWGGYGSDFPATAYTDNFTIQLYADSGGQPETLLHTFLVGNNAVRIRTGDWLHPPHSENGLEGIPDYHYSFDLPTAILAIANTRYWLVIINTITNHPWSWEFSATSLYPGSRLSFVSEPWLLDSHDFAFQLQGSEVPTVNIDIRPGFANYINIDSRGTVQVAILSSPTFDAPARSSSRH